MIVFFIPSFLLVFSQRFRFLAPRNILFCFHILVSKTTWHLFEAAFETVLVINGAGGRRGWRRRKSRRGGILPTDQPQCAWVIPKNPELQTTGAICYPFFILFPFSHCWGAGQGWRDDGEGAFLPYRQCWITHLPKLATWPAKYEVWWNDVKRYPLTGRLKGHHVCWN